MSLADGERWLMAFSQGMPYKVSYQLSPRKTKKVTVVEGRQVEVMAAYQELSFEVSEVGESLLPSLARTMDAPGVVVTGANFDRNLWKLKGVVYVLAK